MKYINIFEDFSNSDRLGVGASYKSDSPILVKLDQLKNRVYAVASIKGEGEAEALAAQLPLAVVKKAGVNVDFLNRYLDPGFGNDESGVIFLISGEGSNEFQYIIFAGDARKSKGGGIMDLESEGKRSSIEELTDRLKITKSELVEILNDAISRRKNIAIKKIENNLKVGSDFVNSLR